MRYTTRNVLHEPDPSDIDFPAAMEANSIILDAAISKRYETATRVPTVTDDASAGYSAGSWWQYTTGPVIYRCTSATIGAAVWKQMWPALDADLTPYIKANGSRGLSAAWTIAYQIISTLAIGTSPFAVTSTTKVANLNSDLLDDLEATAFVKKTDFTAKGSIQVASGANTPGNFSVGTEGQSIIVQAAAGQGLAWDSSRLNGWVAAPALTYAASDAPSYTVTITGDYSAIIMAGMRIKLTDSTVKYFIVTKSVYSNPNTTLTLYGGTDYALSGGAISTPFYSMVKAPAGFPLETTKWVVVFSTTSTGLTGNPTTQSQWYNLHSLSVPIGVWRIRYSAAAYPQSFGEMFATLSKANNTEDDKELTCRIYFTGHPGAFAVPISAEKTVLLAAKTTYYLNAMSNTSTQQFGFDGAEQSTTIKAYCAYL